jgi:hypothetical protein
MSFTVNLQIHGSREQISQSPANDRTVVRESDSCHAASFTAF